MINDLFSFEPFFRHFPRAPEGTSRDAPESKLAS